MKLGLFEHDNFVKVAFLVSQTSPTHSTSTGAPSTKEVL